MSNTTPTIIITTRPNGPLLVSGPCSVVDANGAPFDTKGQSVIALCRCGASATKPFCDGAHKSCGFQAAETAS